MPTTPPENTAARKLPTPSVSDLREIAKFLRARSLNEAGAAGVMDFYRESGVTVQVRLPERDAAGGGLIGDPSEHRAKYTAWMDEHSPDLFVDMAHVLASLADTLADCVANAGNGSSEIGAYSARAAWRQLTAAARLWEQHPDFFPAWAKQDDD